MLKIFFILYYVAFNFCIMSASSIVKTMSSNLNKSLNINNLYKNFYNMTISSDGEISPSYLSSNLLNIEDLDTSVKSIIDFKVLSDKKTMLFATGGKAIIYQSQLGDKTIKSIASFDNYSFISSILVFKEHIYVAANPNGTIYKLTMSGDIVNEIKLELGYVWDIKVSETGRLFCITGDTSGLYEIVDNKPVLLSSFSYDKHLSSFTIHKNNIYMISNGKGVLYKYNLDDKKSSIIYECDEDSILGIVNDKEGNIYIGTSTKKTNPRYLYDLRYQDKFEAMSLGLSSSKNIKPKSKSKEKTKYKNSVYKISSNGDCDKLFTLDNTIINTLRILEDTLYIATGDIQGSLYSYNIGKKSNNILYSIYKSKHSTITNFYFNDNSIILSTANLPDMVLLDLNKISKESVYVSNILGDNLIDRWVTFNWVSNKNNKSNISVFIRTGNSNQPDNTWGDWEKQDIQVKSNYFSSNISRYYINLDKIKSKYLQYKVVLTNNNDSIKIQNIYISYLSVNTAPYIIFKSFKCLPYIKSAPSPDINFMDSLTPSRNCVISWKAKDHDIDPLLYSIDFQRNNSGEWFSLVSNISNTKYIFDINKFLNGEYKFRIKVDDSSINGDRSKSKFAYLGPYIIDNIKPYIDNVDTKVINNTLEVSGEAIDNINIKLVQISINGSYWMYVSALDKVYDSEKEKFIFRFNLDKHKPLNGNIVLKVIDGQLNYSLYSVFLTKK